MQYFGGQTKGIMRDVQLLSSKAILGFPLVEILQKFLGGYLVCLRPFPAAGHITTAFAKFTK